MSRLYYDSGVNNTRAKGSYSDAAFFGHDDDTSLN